jgi:hypothetical protein
MIAKDLIISTKENPKNCIFSPKTSKRFKDTQGTLIYLVSNTPGVGDYRQSIERSKANYIISNCKSQLPKSFPIQKRD